MKGALAIHRPPFYTNCRGEFTPRIIQQQFTAEKYAEETQEKTGNHALLMRSTSIQAYFLRVPVFSAVKDLFRHNVDAAGMRFTRLFGFATMPEL